jgi:hypothetical protein
VPRSDPWNQRLVDETASLLVEALRWMRDHDLLDTMALRCLPLDPTKFGENSMFAPLFSATKQALSAEPLLPRSDAGHVPAAHARLARTQELRELFTPPQLSGLFGEKQELAWLSSAITQDRTPELRSYFMQELGIMEVTPEMIIPRLDKSFLESQPDAWVLNLYDFLNGQPALRKSLSELHLIRLEDGTHVAAHQSGQPQAFLPGAIKTSFPTVRASVCATETAREFLQSLGLTKPDPVDDVIRNVLPQYASSEVDVSAPDFATHVDRIVAAFATDSKLQREKLLDALRATPFVMAVDAGSGATRLSKPGEVYLATERLKRLFAGVTDVLLVDDSYACLRGESVRDLLEACGAVRHLRPTETFSLSREDRGKLRMRAGHPETSGQNDRVTDWMLSGLTVLLETLPRLQKQLSATRAKLLWEELAHLEERRGEAIFTGEYTWTHYGSYRAPFDAAFVRTLNEIAWVPDANGELQRPDLILFDTLDWKPHPFLQSKIQFKPAIIETLAREAGLEPGMLDLLKTLGVTSEAELRHRLGLEDEPTPAGDGSPGSTRDTPEKVHAKPFDPTQPVPERPGAEPSVPGAAGGGNSRGAGDGGVGTGHGDGASGGGRRSGRDTGTRSGPEDRRPGGAAGRPFISYVSTHPDDEEPDPDGLDQSTRMALEAQAIELILSREREWQRTPTHNPGFDLFKAGEDGRATRWCEVKAMTGSLHDRPVGLSRTQFECAQKQGEAYWLYVVEHAGTDTARIVRVQDPAGKARTFTFDHGWLGVADVDTEHEDREG